MAQAPYLSLLVPVYNEEENIAALAAEASAALGGLGRPYEVLLIDDGSKDSSWARIEDAVRTYAGFRGIHLGANFGQTAALAAGLKHARGAVIGCADADLQNDPRDIPAMLRKLEEGYDLVSGWRKDRKDPWLTRRLPSMTANWLISRVTGVRLHDYGCTLKLYRAAYVKDLRLYGEMHRFIPAYCGFMGARIAEMPVNHRARTRGASKYGLSRTLKVVLDLITIKFMDSYLTKPIYLFGGGGSMLLLLGMLMAADTLYKKVCLGVYVKDQPLFQVSIFFAAAGLQLVLLGLIAEILIRVYYDIKDKPSYFIRDRAGFAAGPDP